MSEALAKLEGGELIGLAAVVFWALAVAVMAVAKQWRRVRQTELEASLKHAMLDKGMGAAEIEQVLRASQDSRAAEEAEAAAKAGFTGEPAVDKAALVKIMVENDWSGEDIERVLRAFDGHCPTDASSDERPGLKRAAAEKAAVVETMVNNGLEAEAVEPVLHAFQPRPAGRTEAKEWAGGKV